MSKSLGRYDVNLDKLAMVKMFSDAATFNDNNMLPSVKKLLNGRTSVEDIEKLVDELYSKSKLNNSKEVNEWMEKDMASLLSYNDALINFAGELGDESPVKLYRTDLEAIQALRTLQALPNDISGIAI